MARLLVHVEGVTEEIFVNEVLAPHLYNHGFSRIGARLIGNARQRDRRGGIKAWSAVRKDIVSHLWEDQACFATTIVDYYGMPGTGSKAWPGRPEAAELIFPEKARKIEGELSAAIGRAMGSGLEHGRFIPYVMMHEFEALLFSDCERFGQAIGYPQLAPRLQDIRNQFTSPEEIDDSPETAPSKRIAALVPGYQKPLMGTMAALEIGLSAMRSVCPHFRSWLEQLEAINAC